MEKQAVKAIPYEHFIGKFTVYEMVDGIPDCSYYYEDDRGRPVPLTFDTIEDAEDEIFTLQEAKYEEFGPDITEDEMEMIDEMTNVFMIGYADMDVDGHVVIYDENGLIMEFFCEEQFK